MDSKTYQAWAITKDRPTYQDLADRLSQYKGNLRLIHAVMGLAGEVGEVTDTVKKTVMYDKPLDVENVKEECSDILWYMAILLDQIGSSFEEVMQINHDKLEKRYPTGFTEKAAVLRADKAYLKVGGEVVLESNDVAIHEPIIKVGDKVRLKKDQHPYLGVLPEQVATVSGVDPHDERSFMIVAPKDELNGYSEYPCHMSCWEKV